MFDFCQQTSVRRSVLRHNTMQLGELLNWNELSMVCRWIDGWMNRWMDGRMNGWKDEWMDGWMNG